MVNNNLGNYKAYRRSMSPYYDDSITQKSLDSLKLNPIPFYVKPQTPVIQSAQELGYKLETMRYVAKVFPLIDNMEQWENDK